MFFYLSKILGFILSPLVWVTLFLLFSFYTKNELRAKRLRIWAFIIFYVCTNSFVVDECFRHWEPVTPDYEKTSATFDGAIVLGGIGDVDLRKKKLNFGHSADRLFQALPLYYSGMVKRIVFTGGSGSVEFPQKREAIYVKKYLRSIHFPDSALIIENESRNTYQNAVFTKKILDSLQLNGRYLLVTSAFHMPRAMAVFTKAGYTDISPFITNKVSGVRRFTPDHLLIPDPAAAIGMQLLIHEWIGFIIYKIKGYA